MRIDLKTQHEEMFSFLPHTANPNHAIRLLQMLHSHGIRDTREITEAEWDLLIQRVMEQPCPA